MPNWAGGLLAFLLGWALVVAFHSLAPARNDDHRYDNSPNKAWFESSTARAAFLAAT
jgi:hypothetical protein